MFKSNSTFRFDSSFLWVTVPTLYICTSSAVAGPPTAYDGWSATGGNITVPCPAGAACSAPVVQDDGIFIREITLGGVRYFQSVLTTPGASGSATAAPFSAARGNLNFSNEFFVRTDSNPNAYTNGLADKLVIIESDFTSPTTEQRLIYEAKTHIGWATDTVAAHGFSIKPGFDINTYQAISTVSYDATLPRETFAVTSAMRNINEYTFDRDLSQSVDLDGGGVQKFKQRHLSAYLQPSSHTPDPANPLLQGGTNGGDFAWGPVVPRTFLLDQIKATWVGQSQPSQAEGGVFGYTQYWGESAGVSQPVPLGETSFSSFSDPNPRTWAAPFGPAPSITASNPIQATAVVAEPVANPTKLPAVTPLAGTGNSGSPIPFDQWTMATGVVTPTTPCPAGVICGEAITGNGFFQRRLAVGDKTYYQTIVASENASGDPTAAAFTATTIPYVNESVIQIGSEGIANKLELSEQKIVGTAFPEKFNYSVKQNTGWALTAAADPTIIVQQTVASDASAASFRSRFDMKGAQDGSKDMDIAYDTATLASAYPINFRNRIIQGTFQTSTHIPDPAAPILPNGSQGGDINWSVGESIQAVWIGAQYIEGDPFRENHTISVTAYRNLTTGEATDFIRLTDPNPASWVSPFGPPAPVWSLTVSPL